MPIVTIETWVPPALRQPSTFPLRSPTPVRGRSYVLPAEVLDRPVQLADAIAQPVPSVDDMIDAAAEEDEPVRQPGRPVERRLARPTKPYRDGARRFRHQGGPVHPVEAAREVDDRLCEQLAEQLDLLLLPGAAGCKVLPERLVLDVVPADPDSEAKPAAGQEVNIGSLACHERSLALREDQDAGGEADPLGDGGQVGEHYERVVERVVLGVRARQRTGSIGMNGTEHVVVGEEVVKTEVLDRSPNSPNRGRISPKFVLRVHDAYLHGPQSASGRL